MAALDLEIARRGTSLGGEQSVITLKPWASKLCHELLEQTVRAER